MICQTADLLVDSFNWELHGNIHRVQRRKCDAIVQCKYINERIADRKAAGSNTYVYFIYASAVLLAT